jgi:sugar lactone lactonase YvrE
MNNRFYFWVIIAFLLILIGLTGCSSVVKPVSWEAPINPGYTGIYAENEILKAVEHFSLGGEEGPECVAVDAEGRIYASTLNGKIVRMEADGSRPAVWAETGGRPLGIVFDKSGNLIVADAYRGLLSVSPDAVVTELATEAGGIPIRYANDADVAADGRIFFSDASTKFGAREFGGTLEACVMDTMEHGGHGRLLCYYPDTGKVETLLTGINFANGVAVSHDQQFVLLSETTNYRIIRYWIAGEKKGTYDYILEALPGFPDNITTGMNGLFWIALVSPRVGMVDSLSESPTIRSIGAGLPGFMRPGPKDYSHVIAINQKGQVIYNLQDPDGGYPMISSAREAENYLYLGSLTEKSIGRINKKHFPPRP